MECIHCKGEMERKKAPFHIDRKDYHLMFDAIPAWVCSQCSEVYFEDAEVDSIQEVLKTLDKRTEKLAASV